MEILILQIGGVTEFANKYGRNSTQISQWRNASPDSKTGKPRSISKESAREIEKVFNKPMGWMDQPAKAHQTTAEYNVTQGPDILDRVPLISSVQAGNWGNIIDSFQPGDAEDWLFYPKKLGPSAFALRVSGVSMEPKYQHGDIIFVDPDVAAEHGKNIVVRLDEEDQATFKQLIVEEDGQKFLKPLNPDWPGPKLIPINGNATICGVVIGKWVPE